MLFNSLGFIFLFLPLTLLGYYLLVWAGLRGWLLVYLTLVSLVFYGIANPRYTALLMLSMAANYGLGRALARVQHDGKARATNWGLALGVLGNLAVLGWYKYANFFVDNVNALGGNLTLAHILLPLGISFYTFQQIGYLVDVARGEVRTQGSWRYAAFVIFFPRLTAGPITRYNDMERQLIGRNPGRFRTADLTIGLTIFAIGLFKKTVIAASAGIYATPIYDAVAAGEPIGLVLGWTAALAYTIQLYFDFSGYSDMAIGVARMFGIRLPANFHSPLRAASIIDYWRRWHISLQLFIVAYMYQPLVLPLSRLAAARGFGKWPSFALTVALPTIFLFTIVGLWHGAAWTFVIFGLMHGAYLATNEFWRALRRKSRRSTGIPVSSRLFYHLLTLVAVIFANVMFRAANPAEALTIWKAMLSLAEIGHLPELFPANVGQIIARPGLFFLLVAAIVFLFPNTQMIMGRYGPVLHWARWRNLAPAPISLRWRPNLLWAILSGVTLLLGVVFILRGQTEFIYFNF